MIILDTNVLSELTKPVSDSKVLAWLDSRDRGELATTAITKAEMLSGAMALEDGSRKRRIIELIAAALAPFQESILAFDADAAALFAELTTRRRRLGRPVGVMDAQIAAIALSNSAGIATRDIDGFSGLGIDLINPWTD